MPLVSIIMPAYNSREFIGEALDSIAGQTISDYEVIVIDDGSTDNTAQIAIEHPIGVNLIKQTNRGPAAARNLGVSDSTGKFVAFLDADDLWKPTKLEKQLALFKADPELGMVFTENSLFDARGTFRDNLRKKELLMHGEIARNILLHSRVATPTVMVRRDVLDVVGLFEEQLTHAEDDNLWIRIAAQYAVALVDESLVWVRDHGSRTTRNTSKCAESVLQSIELLRTKYGNRVWDAVEPVISEVLSDVYFDSGYLSFENDELREARRSFSSSIRNNPGNRKVYPYYACTLLPRPLVRALRWIKQKLIRFDMHKNHWVRHD